MKFHTVEKFIPSHEILIPDIGGYDEEKEDFFFDVKALEIINENFPKQKLVNWLYTSEEIHDDFMKNLPKTNGLVEMKKDEYDDEYPEYQVNLKHESSRNRWEELVGDIDQFYDEDPDNRVYAYIDYRSFKKELTFPDFCWKEEPYNPKVDGDLPEPYYDDGEAVADFFELKNCVGAHGHGLYGVGDFKELKFLKEELRWSGYSDHPQCKNPIILTHDGKKFVGSQVKKTELVDAERVTFFGWK